MKLIIKGKEKMMVYVEFLQRNERNERKKVDSLMGSDGYFILDGRNNLDTWIQDALERREKLRNVQSQIIGFRIMKGRKLFQAREIYKFIED